MTLYQKVMQGKKTTYQEYVEPKINIPFLENKQTTTLLSALTISMLMSIQDQLPQHATLSRRIKKVEEAVRDLAALNGEPLDADLVTAGVKAWNASMYSLQSHLSEGGI
jgi:hypothetical protein